VKPFHPSEGGACSWRGRGVVGALTRVSEVPPSPPKAELVREGYKRDDLTVSAESSVVSLLFAPCERGHLALLRIWIFRSRVPAQNVEFEISTYYDHCDFRFLPDRLDPSLSET